MNDDGAGAAAVAAPSSSRRSRRTGPRSESSASGRSIKPGVELSNVLDEECTVIRVTCEDRPGLLLDLTEHLKAQQLTIIEANVKTEGSLAVDIFHVLDIGTEGKISTARMNMLRESLEQLCGAVSEADGWELNQHLGDTSTLRAHMMTREQWEIDRSALVIHENGCLGRGSFGEVHRGSWRGTEVAVKRLREDMANDRELLEFRRELAIVNHLAHPNIVQFLGACTNSMPLCIVTEFMPGGNLADLLAARGEDKPFPVGKCLNWALDCAKGMRYLHERRPTMIIHRDLKPENLLLDASGRVKITDFGLSKSAMQLRGERSATSEEQTVSRTTCGTWLYTAPEVFKKEPYSAKVDQFAFAMIMFELLQGVPPFRNMPAEEATVQLALGHRPAFKRDISPELRELVERCWHHDPAERPSFSDIQRSLDAALARLTPADFEERGARSSLMSRASSGSGRSGGGTAAAADAQPQCACVIS